MVLCVREKKMSLLLLGVWTEVQFSIYGRYISSQVIKNIFTEWKAGVEVSANIIICKTSCFVLDLDIMSICLYKIYLFLVPNVR